MRIKYFGLPDRRTLVSWWFVLQGLKFGCEFMGWGRLRQRWETLLHQDTGQLACWGTGAQTRCRNCTILGGVWSCDTPKGWVDWGWVGLCTLLCLWAQVCVLQFFLWKTMGLVSISSGAVEELPKSRRTHWLWAPKWGFYLKQWYLMHYGLWKSKTCFFLHPGHVGWNPGLLVMGSFPHSPLHCWNIILFCCRRLSEACPKSQGLGAAILNLIVHLVTCRRKKNPFLIMNLVIFLYSEEICSTAGGPGGEWRNTA